VYVLEGLPNAVKVGILAFLLILFVALLLYLQARSSGRRR